MINKAILVGRVGKEPKSFDGKTKVVSFSVATDCGYGENKTTIWENVKTFGKLAETCEKFVRRGMLVYVEGRREQNEGKDGKLYTEVVANEVRFLSKVDGETIAEAPKSERVGRPKRVSRVDVGKAVIEPDDDADLPF